MHTYYLSLTRGLVGYYVKFIAPDETTVRKHAHEYFGRLWCTVYTEEYFEQLIKARFPNTKVINPDKPVELDDWRWE